MSETLNEHHGEHPLNHLGQLLGLILFIVVWVGDSFFFHWSTFLSEYVNLWIRLGLLLLSISIVIYLFRAVISAFSREGDTEGIIRSGPFRTLRHPMYTACVVFYIGLSLSTLSLLSILLTVGIFLFYNAMASFEENNLIGKYGDDYIGYTRKTGKFFPRVFQ